MTQKELSPRKAGNAHKLAGWVRCNSTVVEAMLLAAFFAGVAWQGVAQ